RMLSSGPKPRIRRRALPCGHAERAAPARGYALLDANRLEGERRSATGGSAERDGTNVMRSKGPDEREGNDAGRFGGGARNGGVIPIDPPDDLVVFMAAAVDARAAGRHVCARPRQRRGGEAAVAGV